METKTLKINEELVNKAREYSIELSGLNNMLAFCLASEYEVPESKINTIKKDIIEKNSKYDSAKTDITKFIKAQMPEANNWSLDFETGIATVEC